MLEVFLKVYPFILKSIKEVCFTVLKLHAQDFWDIFWPARHASSLPGAQTFKNITRINDEVKLKRPTNAPTKQPFLA